MPRNVGGADAMAELGLGPDGTAMLVGKSPSLPLKSVENAAELEKNKGWALRVNADGGKSFVLQQGTSIMKNWKQMVDGQRDRIGKIKSRAEREVRAERARCKTLQQDVLRLQGVEARLRREGESRAAREGELGADFAKRADEWKARIERADRESQRSSKLVAEFVGALQRLETENRALRANEAALRAQLATSLTAAAAAATPRALEQALEREETKLEKSRLEQLFQTEVAALRGENHKLRLELLDRDALAAADQARRAARAFDDPSDGGGFPKASDAGDAPMWSGAPPASREEAPSRPRSKRGTGGKKKGMAVRGQSASLYADRARVRGAGLFTLTSA